MRSPYFGDLEQAIWQVAEHVLGPQALVPSAIHREIRELSKIYNSRIPSTARHRYDLARLLFFTLADMPKVFYPLLELLNRNQLPDGRSISVLDVGAGYGAMSLGLVGLLAPSGSSRQLRIDAVDRDSRALSTLELLLQASRELAGHGAGVTLRVATGDLSRGLELTPPYDLILMGNVLNEMDAKVHLPLAHRLLDALGPTGHLILMEPALSRTSRQLLLLRDGLLAGGTTTVFAPCTHQGPCPALADPRDWCHERRLVDPPPRLRSLAAATGLRRRHLKWSYLTLNRHGASLCHDPPDGWRVVSGPIKSKGKLEYFLCGSEGRIRAMRLNRHRAPCNAEFENLDRGRLVWLEEADGETRRVGPATRILAEDPASQAG